MEKYGYVCFYISYSTVQGRGCTTIVQASEDDSFDIASAFKMLISIHGEGVIIDSWHQLSPKRKSEFDEFLRTVMAEPKGKEKAGHLTLVKNDPSQF
jgi:hypothetical protein